MHLCEWDVDYWPLDYCMCLSDIGGFRNNNINKNNNNNSNNSNIFIMYYRLISTKTDTNTLRTELCMCIVCIVCSSQCRLQPYTNTTVAKGSFSSQQLYWSLWGTNWSNYKFSLVFISLFFVFISSIIIIASKHKGKKDVQLVELDPCYSARDLCSVI
jgi:hypothetical protein